MEDVRPGLSAEASETVTFERTAPHFGSGRVSVYATPALGALVERIAAELVEPLLADGQTTVGTHLEIDHLAPTPLGGRVTARVELTAVEENERLHYSAEIRDEQEPIGRVQHIRAVIDTDRFLRRVAAKNEGNASA